MDRPRRGARPPARRNSPRAIHLTADGRVDLETHTMAAARVLVIDDEEGKRATLAAALAIEGFDAIGVPSAEAASRASDSNADVAIVDLMLHGTNGFELARKLRSSAPQLRVILTSEYHFSPMQLEKVNCGAIAFVPRPIAFDELASFLRTKLAERRVA